MGKLESIEEILGGLQELGFNAEPGDGFASVKIGDPLDPFVAILMIDDDSHLNVTCQVGLQGDFKESDLPLIFYNALCENSRIRPFAFEIIDTRDDPTLTEPENFPLVLADSMPLVDLSLGELEATMQKLLGAIRSCGEVLKV